MPDSLELMLRGGGAALYLMLAMLLLRDGGDRPAARLGALFALSTGWWSLNTGPLAAWGHQWAFPVVALSYGKSAAFWLFTRALFDDDFRLRRTDWVIWLGMVVSGGLWMAVARLGLQSDVVRIPHQIAQIVLASSAAWVAWQGRSTDLVESRRGMRLAFVLLSALMMVGITGGYLLPGRPTPLMLDLNVFRLFVTALGLAWLVTGLRTTALFDLEAPAPKRAPGLAVDCINPVEQRLLARLRSAMEEDRIYRNDRLTIGGLAERLRCPEYALRRLINGRLGYRNFNAFLNEWRLQEARAALADPGQAGVPISTIALDAGFASFGPFNRAFRATEGCTPSAYRERRRADVAQPSASPNLKRA